MDTLPPEELIQQIKDSKLQSIKFRYTLSIISNVVLTLFVVGLGFYIYRNIEAFKIIGQDVCRLCMEKTGAICTANNNPTVSLNLSG